MLKLQNPIVSTKNSDAYLKALRKGFLILNNKKGSYQESTSIIENELIKNGIRLENISRNIWVLIFQYYQGNEITRSHVLPELLKEIKGFDYIALNTNEWLEIYALFLRLGLFQAGFHIRTLAIKYALKNINNPNKTKIDLWYGILASIEISNFQLAKELIEIRNRTYGVDFFTKTMQYLVALLEGEEIQTLNLDYIRENTNCEFFNYINDQEIAIVGPAKTSHKDASEIDGFEKVMRFNYRESGIGCDSQIKGKKVDLTYFNYSQAKSIMDNKIIFPNDPQWIVFKDDPQCSVQKYQQRKNNNPSKSRNLIYHYKFCFNGTYNMLPIVLLDILQINPKRIKLFHADLMLSVERDTRYYPQNFNLDSYNNMVEIFLRHSVKHDPVGQFIFLKNVFKRKNIESDNRFREVISLGAEEYMHKLQSIYKIPIH